MKSKKVYLEIIRIFAIFFVIYVHTGADAAEHYQAAGNLFSYGLSLVLYCIAQVSVPLFFLITGAVLLHKEESLKTVLKHRALRIFLIILLFGFIQYAYFYYLNPEIEFSLPVFFKMVYSTNVITQYWYLYSYFALMLILPFVRMLARSMDNAHFWYLFGLYFLLEGILPIVEYLWGNSRIILSIPLFAGSLFYPLLGYYVSQRSGEFFYQKKILLLTNLAGFCSLFTNTVVAYMAHRQRGAAESLEGMTALLALVIFIDIRSLCYYASHSLHPVFHCAFSQLFCKAVCFIGGGVFGVYLLEPPLRDTFRFIYMATEPYISWFPAAILWICTAILFGSILFQLLKRLPLLRKIL